MYQAMWRAEMRIGRRFCRADVNGLFTDSRVPLSTLGVATYLNCRVAGLEHLLTIYCPSFRKLWPRDPVVGLFS